MLAIGLICAKVNRHFFFFLFSLVTFSQVAQCVAAGLGYGSAAGDTLLQECQKAVVHTS